MDLGTTYYIPSGWLCFPQALCLIGPRLDAEWQDSDYFAKSPDETRREWAGQCLDPNVPFENLIALKPDAELEPLIAKSLKSYERLERVRNVLWRLVGAAEPVRAITQTRDGQQGELNRAEWRRPLRPPCLEQEGELDTDRDPSDCERRCVLFHESDLLAKLGDLRPPSRSTAAAETQCGEWIKGLVEDWTHNERQGKQPNPRPKKSDLCDQALNKFKGLSKNRFQRQWSAIAPEDWKQSGPKR